MSWSPICECGRPIRDGGEKCLLCRKAEVLPPPSEVSQNIRKRARSLDEVQRDAESAGIPIPVYKGVLICSEPTWVSWLKGFFYLAIAVFIGWVIWQAWPKSG
nr:hypothetical protein [uncultured bacterium]AQS30220.1 hypothetical protein [uncultured bacterium]